MTTRGTLKTSLFTPINSTLLSSFSLENTTTQSPTTQRSSSSSRHGSRTVAQSLENDRGIIIGSTLGGAALVLVCLALVLYPIWQRHRTPSRLSKTGPFSSSSSPPTPMPRPSAASDFDLHRVRPVTPSPRRLVATNNTFPKPISRSWDVEKAIVVHTPSGHPATNGWRGDLGKDNKINLGSNDSSPPVVVEEAASCTRPANKDDAEHQAHLSSSSEAEEGGASISTTFAAEMSSILESISIKSSYSSLRSSGAAVLGVPTRLQTPLSVQKLRAQNSCATSVGGGGGSGGAVRGGSASDCGGGGGINTDPYSLSTRVPSKSSPPPSSKGENHDVEEK